MPQTPKLTSEEIRRKITIISLLALDHTLTDLNDKFYQIRQLSNAVLQSNTTPAIAEKAGIINSLAFNGSVVAQDRLVDIKQIADQLLKTL